MSSYTRQILENWLKTIDVKADRVLDIGGSQNSIKGRTKSWDVKDYKILDLEEPHECKQKPDIVCDLNEKIYDWKIIGHNGLPLDEPGCCNDDPTDVLINEIPKYKSKKIFEKELYDISFCLEVSEYLYNPLQVLKNINYFLKKGGILYISFHFIYPVHNPVDQDYLRYTPKGVEKLLQEAGFKIDEMYPRKAMANLYGYYANEKMRPAKDYYKHDWTGCLVKAIKL